MRLLTKLNEDSLRWRHVSRPQEILKPFNVIETHLICPAVVEKVQGMIKSKLKVKIGWFMTAFAKIAGLGPDSRKPENLEIPVTSSPK